MADDDPLEFGDFQVPGSFKFAAAPAEAAMVTRKPFRNS
jgi:hypothetical protein